MPRIINHAYIKAYPSGKCLTNKHDKCTGIAVIGIHGLRRPCACSCHTISEQSDILPTLEQAEI